MLMSGSEQAVLREAGAEEKKFVPRRRQGTKSFLDVPIDLRLKDFESESGQYFMNILPSEVRKHFKRAILETGIASGDAFKWLEYALSSNGNGPVSPIAQWVNENPYNPRAFKYIYREEPALSELDHGYVITTGAFGIYQRLQVLVERLPIIIRDERKRFGLKTNEPYVIYNLGAAYSLDTIYAVAKNPELKALVKIICVDPDAESLDYGRKLAEKLGVSGCFQFIPKKMEEAGLDKAHMLLFIGMFCPIPTKRCILTLQYVKQFLVERGIAIFSTVQEEMLMGGPILDFIMWSYGWRMYFKSDSEPGQIARLAGYDHDKSMDFEDILGYNRMTVARAPKDSIFGSIGNVLRFARTLMM